MQPIQQRFRSASKGTARREPTVGRPKREAGAPFPVEAEGAAEVRLRPTLVAIAPAGLLAGLLPVIFPFTPGYSPTDAGAATIAAAITALVAVGVVPYAERLARTLRRGGAGDTLILTVALLSAGAAATHFAVAKMHFEEYTLFGVFFVGSGIAQLVWPLWLLLRRWPPLLLLGAVGNASIVVTWGIDRIWGLPLGPEHWTPDPVGFGDAATSSFEALLVIGCVALLRRGAQRRHLHSKSAFLLTGAVVVVTTLSLLSVLGVGSSVLTPTV